MPRDTGADAAPGAPAALEPPPYVPAQRLLPEMTVRAVLLGVILSALLAGANAYLGLFAGMTVSASIPAAVISMGVLRLLRRGTILENNIVQTAASAGESLAAGVIFTIPALVMLGAWSDFRYFGTTLIAALGGLLGVLFTIPLRRALIVENPLRFPEGVATAEVLKAGDTGGPGIITIAAGALAGALFKFGETGLRLWAAIFERAAWADRTVLYFGTNLSPALVGVGYIVGLNIAVLIFVGGAANWYIAIPLLAAFTDAPPDADPADFANQLWSARTRYLGVGAMAVGGIWALICVRRSLAEGIRSGWRAWQRSRAAHLAPSTERDTPMPFVVALAVVALVPLYVIFEYATGSAAIAAVMAVVMLIAGFLFSAVAGYMAGLVGSSNNPISGVTIATILTASLLLLALMGPEAVRGPAAAILIGATVCCAAAIAGDNMQDLKAGRLVGATPYKQQIIQCVGVLAGALVMAPVLTLLHHAYGIGAPTPEHPQPLTAPQATLMASVARGVFHGALPWSMVAWGAAVAVVVIACDLLLARRGSAFRLPVLAVAVGLYLPLELSVPIGVGGVVAWLADRARRSLRRRAARPGAGSGDTSMPDGGHHGLLLSAGLITGEALVGIAMAVPIVATGRSDVLAFWGVHEWTWPGILLLAAVVAALYRVARRPG